MTDKLCACCGASMAAVAKKKYCSDACVRKVRTDAERERRKGGWLTTRECPACGIKFVRDGGTKYCSDRCREIIARTMSKPREGHGQAQLRKCDKCRQPFAAARDMARCYFCRQEDAHLRANHSEAAPKFMGKKKELACVSCEHWVPTPGAELGFSCNIHFWLRCQPYLPKAKPWKAKAMGV